MATQGSRSLPQTPWKLPEPYPQASLAVSLVTLVETQRLNES